MMKLFKDIVSTATGVPSSMRILVILGVIWVFAIATYLFIVNEFDETKSLFLMSVLVILLGGKVLQHGNEDKQNKPKGGYDDR